jgi:hypothetical protein
MRDLLIVLGTALLLRACETQGDGAEASVTAAAPLAARLRSAAEPQPEGRWRRVDGDGPLLLFEAGGARPLAALRCDKTRSRLLVERMTVRPAGGVGTMTIRADNRVRTLPVLWDGASLPIAIGELELGDRLVDSLARPSGRIELELGSEPLLSLPADRLLGELIDECRASEQGGP